MNSILAVLLVILSWEVCAQRFKFEQFTTKDGLLSDEVYNLHQDKKGYLWLFTEYGAMKYNGKVFEAVLKNLPAKESVMYAVYENREGRMWVANSNKNIYEVINDSAFIIKGIEATSDKLKSEAQEIYQLYVDDSLNIYAKTWVYTIKFIKDDHYRAVYVNQQILKTPYYEKVLKLGDAYMSVWKNTIVPALLYRKNLIYKFIDKGHAQDNIVLTLDGFGLIKYCKRFGNDLYLSIHNRIVKLDSSCKNKEIQVKDIILNFTKDRNNHLWVACYRDGLREYDEKDSLLNHYFEGITINDVMADNNNGLWLSTDGQGIYHCPNINESYYDKSSPLGKPVNFIKKIKKDLFVGTNDVHIFRITDKTVLVLKKAWDELDDQPLDIIPYNDKYLACYNSHIESINKSGIAKVFSKKTFFLPYRALSYTEDTLALLGRNRIAFVHNNAHEFFEYEYPRNIKFDFKTYAFVRSKKGLLVASDKGVFCFENGVAFQPAYLKPTGDFLIKQIKQDFEGNYWFCTKNNGLFKLTPDEKLWHYSMPAGLERDIINDLYFINANSFLLCSNTGLYYHSGPVDKPVIGRLEKIYTGEVQTATFYGDRIYVGTKNGLVVLSSRVLAVKQMINFNLRSIYVNSERVNMPGLRALNYWQNTLEFKFDVITYSKASCSIRYRLAGAVNDSGIVNSDKLNFIGLPPGSYTLTANPVSDLVLAPIVVDFVIVPAVWQRTWFRACVIIGLIIILMYGGFLFFRYNRSKVLKKAESEKLIAEYRLIALKAQINPHFMSNCIAAIQHLILQNKVNEANEYLAKFSFLVRQVLNLSSKALVPLKEEIEIVGLYLKLERLRFDKIAVEFHIDPQIDISCTLIPPLLSQPIIENAIWHGLLPLGLEKTPLLSLSIKQEAGTIRIIIEDNGVGRTMPGNSISNSRESKGIAITRQRIENLKFISGQDLASLSYEDLLDVNGDPAGTRVVISLPDNLHL